MLNQYLSIKLFPSGTSNSHSTECSDDMLCTESQMLDYLMSLDVNKASGPDGISPIMLKHTAHSIAPSIPYRIVQYIHLSGPVPRTLENVLYSANT